MKTIYVQEATSVRRYFKKWHAFVFVPISTGKKEWVNYKRNDVLDRSFHHEISQDKRLEFESKERH